jgi:hypothetical protein
VTTTPEEAPTDQRIARIEYALVVMAAWTVGAYEPPEWQINKEIDDILYGRKDREVLAGRKGVHVDDLDDEGEPS